ncbi:MAG: hypothetical protein GC191_20385 [Azospirillum sp.]|nr:hypothetical protein [Azospirillum sp.]
MSFSETIRDFFSNHSKNAVFVVGCARSGTTLLFNYLNTFDQVFLLCEDLPFFAEKGAYFRSWYNALWRNAGYGNLKGYLIPSYGMNDGYWFDFYQKLSKHYRWIGSKQAFGPHGNHYWNGIDQYCLEFYSSYFPDARYILTLRRPDEILYSMSKLFPGKDFGSMKNAWMKSTIMQISMFATLKDAQFFFLDDVTVDRLARLTGFLGEPGTVSEDYLRLPNPIDPSWPALAERGYELEQMQKAYAFIRKSIAVETGRTQPWVHKQLFCRAVSRRIETLRADPAAAWDDSAIL